MQCKDIEDRPILEFLRSIEGDRPGWGIIYEAGGSAWVGLAMPPGVPLKLRLAKMGMLIRRGLVDGCCCGCRGDFVLTEKGRKYLGTP